MGLEKWRFNDWLGQFGEYNSFKVCGIYQITNIENSKVYIGSSVNIYNRIYHHFWSLGEGRHYNQKLTNAYNKYGLNAFKVEILEACDKDKRLEREQYHLDEILKAQEFTKGEDQCFSKQGYNLIPNTGGGEGVCGGRIVSPQERDEMRLRSSRMWEDPEFRAKRNATVSTPEWKEAARLRQEEVMSRPEVKAKMEAAKPRIKAGRDKWLASEERVQFLEDTKEIRSQVGKDIWKDPQYRAKQVRDDDRKEKWSQSGKANWADEEYRKKQLQAISNPETNKKRAQSVSETRSNPEFSCKWFRKVFAYDLQTGELIMTFNNSKLAHDWIKENRGDVKGLGFSIRVLLEKYKDTGILGYRWEIEENFENKKKLD